MVAAISNFYQVGASLPVDAPSYVKRLADEEFYQKLKAGKFCYVLNSRQMGKSSLRVQTMQRLQASGTVCAAIDLTGIGKHKVTIEQWYGGIVYALVESCQLEDKFDFDWQTWWQKHREVFDSVMCLRLFIEKVLLNLIEQQIVIFVDEIDRVQSQDFSLDDFFALIRFFQNQRVDNPVFERLTFALLGVATPSNLITDKTQTPFNIGEAIELHGFQLDEAQPLIEGLSSRFSHPQKVMKDILHWTGGQPFLTQKLCQFMVEESCHDNPRNVEQVVRSRLVENWESQDEPEHLRTIRDRILRDEQRAGYLLELYQHIRQEEKAEVTADDTLEQSELQLSGLIVRQQNKLKVYNSIYREIFDQSWIEIQLSNLRPYSENFRFWIASDRKDESRLLRGKALQNALLWAKDKSLNFQDREFLAASQAKEKEEAIAAREKEAQLSRERKDREAVEKRNLVLAEANKKAQRRMSIGTAVLILTLSVAVISAVLATVAGNEAFQAQQRLDNASKKASEAEEKVQVAQQNLKSTDQELSEAQIKVKTAQDSEKEAKQKLEEAKQQEKKAQQNETLAKARENRAEQRSQNAKSQEKKAQINQQDAQRKEQEANEKAIKVTHEFKKTQKGLETRQEYLKTVGKLAQLAGKLKDKSFDDEAKELLSQASQSVNIKDDNLKQDLLHTGIAYAYSKLKDANWVPEVSNSLKKVNKTSDDSLESLQIQILTYKTQGNFQREKQENTDAIDSYKNAFKVLKDLKNKTSSISPPFNEKIPIDKKILSKEVVEALHREFINLLYENNHENSLKQEVEKSLKEHFYNELATLLKNKQFKQADEKTKNLMSYIAREKSFDKKSINKLSCLDLRRIDRLWVENSDKRFGLSVQKEIFLKTGNRLGMTSAVSAQNKTDEKNYLEFAKAVGWFVDKGKDSGRWLGSSSDSSDLERRIKDKPELRGTYPTNLGGSFLAIRNGHLYIVGQSEVWGFLFSRVTACEV